MKSVRVNYYCFDINYSVSIYHYNAVLTLTISYPESTTGLIYLCPYCSLLLISWIDLDFRSFLLEQQI